MDEPRTEVFSDARINKALSVSTTIINNWIESNALECRIVVDKQFQGMTFEDLASTYFSVGVRWQTLWV